MEDPSKAKLERVKLLLTLEARKQQMLVVTRNEHQSITLLIGGHPVATIKVKRGRAENITVAIDADPEIQILRSEVLSESQRANPVA